MSVAPVPLFARTGSDLAHDCRTYQRWVNSGALQAEEALDATQCLEYIKGATDGFTYSSLHGWIQPSDSICVPQGFEGKQAVLIVLKWLDNHPEKLHLKASGLVWEALIQPSRAPLKRFTRIGDHFCARAQGAHARPVDLRGCVSG